MSTNDFIAEDDIFIDAQGNVVEKKDAQTKLASKGARVSAEDVEKYGLKKSEPELKGKLPEGFPGLSALQTADMATYAKVRKELAKEKPFEDVDGIGPATAEKIRAAMNETAMDESEESEETE